MKNSDDNGFIGRLDINDASGSYWDVNTSENSTSSGNGEGLTTSEITGDDVINNMDGFDFDDTWETVEDDYPVLRELNKQEQLDNRD